MAASPKRRARKLAGLPRPAPKQSWRKPEDGPAPQRPYDKPAAPRGHQPWRDTPAHARERVEVLPRDETLLVASKAILFELAYDESENGKVRVAAARALADITKPVVTKPPSLERLTDAQLEALAAGSANEKADAGEGQREAS